VCQKLTEGQFTPAHRAEEQKSNTKNKTHNRYYAQKKNGAGQAVSVESVLGKQEVGTAAARKVGLYA